MKTKKIAKLGLHESPAQIGLDLGVLCIGLALSLPFLLPVHDQPIPSFYSEAVAIFLGTIGILLSFITLPSDAKLGIPKIVSLPLALLVPICLQWILGYFAYPSSAAVLIFYLIWAAFLMLAFHSMLDRLGSQVLFPRLAWCVLMGSVLNALIGLCQFFEITANFSPLMVAHVRGAGVYGNLAQENHFATHMALGLAALTYLAFSKKLQRTWGVAFACLLVVAIFLSGSRSGLLYLLLGAGFALQRKWAERSSAVRTSKRIGIILISGFALLLLLTVIITLFFSAQFPQFQRYLTYSETLGTRLYLWRNAWTMFLDAPILGVGFDAFGFQLVEQIGKASQFKHWGIDQYAHNLVLQLLAVSGLTGLLAFLLPVGLFIWRQWRLPLSPEKTWCWLALVVLLIHSLLEQPLYYAYFLACASLFLAGVEGRTWRIGMTPRWRVLIVVGVLGLVIANLKTVADFSLLEKTFFRTEDPSHAQALDDEARKNTIMALHQYSIFTPIVEAISPESFVPHEAAIQEKLALNLRLMHFAPVAEVEYRQVALLAQNHHISAAQQRFRTAAIAYPAQAQMVLQRIKMMAATEPEIYLAVAEFAEDFLTASAKP